MGDDGLAMKVSLTMDAESVYKSLNSEDLKEPAARALLVHISWTRQFMGRVIVHCAQRRDTRDMNGDGHSKGGVNRWLLLQVMSGRRRFELDVKSFAPRRLGDPGPRATRF